jgi:hypothetical protein
MGSTYEITHDGPYMRIVLPDFLPPHWESLRREVAFECDEPVTRAVVVAPETMTTSGVCELDLVIELLEGAGADVFVEWR